MVCSNSGSVPLDGHEQRSAIPQRWSFALLRRPDADLAIEERCYGTEELRTVRLCRRTRIAESAEVAGWKVVSRWCAHASRYGYSESVLLSGVWTTRRTCPHGRIRGNSSGRAASRYAESSSVPGCREQVRIGGTGQDRGSLVAGCRSAPRHSQHDENLRSLLSRQRI